MAIRTFLVQSDRRERYGHWRLRKTILGGVTSTRLPVLMSY